MRKMEITINGVVLTEAQNMTLHCAIQNLATTMLEGLGEDEHGKAMAGYKARIAEINRLMHG